MIQIAAPKRTLLASALVIPFLTQDEPMGWTGVLDEEAFSALHELAEGETPELAGDEIDLDGTRAYLSVPSEGDPIGGVVVIHEWWGLNENIMHWSDRLAADGYAALAVDLYGGTVAMTRDEAMSAMREVDQEMALAVLRTAHSYLVDEIDVERTASIGWCFGGGWSLQLALAEPELDAAVIYYGRLVTDVEALGAIEASVLGIFGERDTGIPPESVAEFKEASSQAGVDLELHTFDAEHAFANPSSARYDQDHAAAAWNRARAFLCKELWPDQVSGSLSDGSRTIEATFTADWEEQGPRTMRIASFGLDDGAECYVTALQGAAGGVEANLNRWREQLGENPLDESEIDALPRIPILGRLAVVMRAEGKFQPMSGDAIDDAALLGAICELEDETLFVKLVGPQEVVEAEERNFAAFCRGLR